MKLFNTYQPTFTAKPKNNNLQMQKLIDSVDLSLIKTQKLKDSFESIGSGDKPIVAVIDDFYAIKCDVNGDNIDDLSHGELASLYTADTASILPVDVNLERSDYFKVIKSVLEAINNGANIKAINISIDMWVTNQEFTEFLLPAIADSSGKTARHKIVSYAKTCQDNINEISRLSCITPEGPKKKQYDFQMKMGRLYPALNNLKDLPDLEIPVYICAGNAVDNQNLLSQFFSDPIVVSSDQPKNVYSKVYNRLEQSLFYVTEVFKDNVLLGYDINEDGKLDVKKEEASRGRSILKVHCDKSLNDNKVDMSYIESIKQELKKPDINEDIISKLLKAGVNKLFSLDQLEDLFNESLNSFREKGEYVFQVTDSEGSAFAFNRILRVDENNKLYCDPLNRGIKNAVHFIDGTSFATPTAIDKDIKAGKLLISA